jgi:hypothetical protein
MSCVWIQITFSLEINGPRKPEIFLCYPTRTRMLSVLLGPTRTRIFVLPGPAPCRPLLQTLPELGKLWLTQIHTYINGPIFFMKSKLWVYVCMLTYSLKTDKFTPNLACLFLDNRTFFRNVKTPGGKKIVLRLGPGAGVSCHSETKRDRRMVLGPRCVSKIRLQKEGAHFKTEKMSLGRGLVNILL